MNVCAFLVVIHGGGVTFRAANSGSSKHSLKTLFFSALIILFAYTKLMFLFRQLMLSRNAPNIVCAVLHCPRVAKNSVHHGWKVRDTPALMFYGNQFRSLPSDGVCRLRLIYGIHLGERSFILVILLRYLPFIPLINLVKSPWKTFWQKRRQKLEGDRTNLCSIIFKQH